MKFVSVFLYCAFFAFSFAGCAGRNIYPDLTDNSQVIKRQWTLSTRDISDLQGRGAEFSNSVLYENTLIFGSEKGGLVSLYPYSSQVRWSLPILNGVVSPILIEKNTLYFGGGDGNLYSVNAETGSVNWRYGLRNPHVSKPAFHSGKLLVNTTDDTIYAFEASTGQWLWHYRRRSAGAATIQGVSQPLIDQEEVIAGLSDGYVVGLSLADGKLKWERKLHEGRKFTDVDAHPVLEDDVLYLPSYDGSLYALRRKDQQVLWRYDAGGARTVKLDGGRIYLSSSDGYLHVLAKENAKILWKFELDNGVPSEVVIYDNLIIFTSTFQYLYALDRGSGKPLYRYNVGYNSGFYSYPTLDAARKRFYVISGTGNLMAFSIEKPVVRK